MAGDDDDGKNSLPRLCKYCRKNVVTAVAKCINCDECFHTSCALRIAGLIVVGKDNLVKCCKTNFEVNQKNVEGNVQKLLEAKDEVLKSREEIISELRAKEALLYKNIELLEEKIGKIDMCKQSKNYSVGTSGTELTEKRSTYAACAVSKPTVPPASEIIISKQNSNLNSQKQNNNKATFSMKTVNAAITEAHTANKMREIQLLGNSEPRDENSRDWQISRPRRTRRFVVGRNDDNNQVQAVPKFTSLHVTRLAPGTKPEQLQDFLEPNFTDVKCEEHVSKHPDIYSSMKVTIKQDDFRNAWKREVWPSGAIVSRFFMKRRMLTNQEDP